jgi:hypothetical protein
MLARVLTFLTASKNPAHKDLLPHAAVTSAFIDSGFFPSDFDFEVIDYSVKLNIFNPDGIYEFTPGPVTVKISTEDGSIIVTATEKNGCGVFAKFSASLNPETIKNQVKSDFINRLRIPHKSTWTFASQSVPSSHSLRQEYHGGIRYGDVKS